MTAITDAPKRISAKQAAWLQLAPGLASLPVLAVLAWLLPRTQHMGRWAPAYNALLFAMLHTAAPWAWPGFFLMTLPWSYLVWWRRSVKIGLFIHIGMLALQWLGMTMVIFGFVEMPA
jgi:hypothetical protein